ncbi:MAG: hypothetical protein IT424_16360 [Pirellulales bacterium]|nr:hypothetical protein [Pirellulales bacterium]
MQTIESHWEDEENNRRVAYSARVIRESGAVEIQDLTPKQVTFLCPESKNEVRSIGVWTDKGRELLAHQLRTSGHLTDLERQIETGLAV